VNLTGGYCTPITEWINLDVKGVGVSGMIYAVRYGEDRPIADNRTKYGPNKNRRVEIEILPPVSKNANQKSVPTDYRG
jgi:hypothetical protein